MRLFYIRFLFLGNREPEDNILPRVRYQRVDPIENMEFYISHGFVFVKGFAERITDNGLSVLCSEDTWGFFILEEVMV